MKTIRSYFLLFTILAFSISFLKLSAQNFNPPNSLRLSEWCYNYNFVWNDPDSTIAQFKHFNIYKDDMLIDSTEFNYCTVGFDPGSHTLSVSTEYIGGESELISINLSAPLGKSPQLILITSEENLIVISWWSTCYYFIVSYMNNYSGSGYYPSDCVSSDSVTYAIKYNWFNKDQEFVGEFSSFEFMPGILYGNGAIDFHFKIFQGDSLPQLIYFQDLNDIQYEQMNNVIIDPPLIVSSNESILLAVTIINDAENISSMMVDDFIPAPGYGDLISLNDSTWFQCPIGGDWVMSGSYTNALWYGGRNTEHALGVREGIVNQYDIYRNGEFLTSTYETRLIDTNFTESDCGNYFEYYITAVYPTCTSFPSDTAGIILDCSSNLNELNYGNAICIYPNPANDVLYIKSENKIDGIIMTDLYGHDFLIPSSKTIDLNQIDISKLNSGVYILKITINGFLYSEKVVVMHTRY